MKFYEKLIILRKKALLSQEELAEKLDVTRQTISKWELGQSKPDIDKLQMMSKLFEVDVNTLTNEDISLEDNGETKEDKNNKKEEQGMYIDKILLLVNRDFSSNGYYTQMAAGWLLAECFVTFPLDTWRYLTDKENMKLDNVSYKKAIRKICESLTPDDEVKKVVRELA